MVYTHKTYKCSLSNKYDVNKLWSKTRTRKMCRSHPLSINRTCEPILDYLESFIGINSPTSSIQTARDENLRYNSRIPSVMIP